MDRVSDLAESELILSEERARAIKALDPFKALVAHLIFSGWSIEQIAKLLNMTEHQIKCNMKR